LYGFYASTTIGLFIGFRPVFRLYHTLKALEVAPNTEDRLFHTFFAGANEAKLSLGNAFAYRLWKRGVVGGLLLPCNRLFSKKFQNHTLD
jgi:hypothetical protein